MLQMLDTSADRLGRSIGDLTDDQVAAPSLLPGWTRGHVLTHLARNADALVNLLTWARTGVETPMYPSRQVRDQGIEAGARRPAAEHRADLADAHARFMAAAAQLGEEDWHARLRWGYDDREGTAEVVPWLRLVELEVHHVDLDLGYTPAHWGEQFVRRQLARTLEDYRLRDDVPAITLTATDEDVEHVLGPDGSAPGGAGRPVVAGPQAALLAWLIGRSDGAGLTVRAEYGEGAPAVGGSLPVLPPWR
jgi:maleylpyruvate isomerase